MNQFERREIVVGAAIVLVVAAVSFGVTRKLIGTDSVHYDAFSAPVDGIAGSSISEALSEITTSQSGVSPKGEAPAKAGVLPGQLEKPLVHVSSGSFRRSDFPIPVRITNPNDESTWLMMSVNRGGFREFAGGLIRLHPSDYVEAYARGDTEQWFESETVSVYCRLKEPPRKQRPVRVPVRKVRAGEQR